jgi:hypothetical protein
MDNRTWLDKLPNSIQPPEERRAKYALCLALGDNVSIARRRRDTRWPQIARHHGWPDAETMFFDLQTDRQTFISAHRNGNGEKESEECSTYA